MSRIDVSLGMPVYNGAKYIRVALDSILAQTFQDFELIISDNASSDETRVICEEFALKDARIKYFRQSTNLGALNNFKFVLDQASAPFFMWTAADDYWSKNWITDIYSRIRGCANVAGIGDVCHVDEESQPLDHFANEPELNFRGPPFWRKLKFFMAFEGRGKANLFYSIFPRELLKGFEKLGTEDYQILYVLLNRIEFAQVNGPKLYKRIHGNSGSSVADREFNQKTKLKVIQFIKKNLTIADHYIICERSLFQIVLILTFPIKVLTSVFLSAVRRLR